MQQLNTQLKEIDMERLQVEISNAISQVDVEKN